MAQHPTEENINITRKFLGGELGTSGQAPGERQFVGGGPGGTAGRTLPGQAAPIAGQRAFGQQGAQRRRQPVQSVQPIQPGTPAPLSNRFFNLPGPVDFAQTPQGRAILQRILGGTGRRRF